MKRLLICLITVACVFPVSAHAEVGVNIRVVNDGLGTSTFPSVGAGNMNPPNASSGVVLNGGYSSETGYRGAPFRTDGLIQWRQPSGTATDPLFVYDPGSLSQAHCIDAKYPDFAARVPGFTQMTPWSGATVQWSVHSIGSLPLSEAPYQTVTVTVAGTLHPVSAQLTVQELDFLARVNAERASLGRPPLRIDTRLNSAADSHVHWLGSMGWNSSHCGIYRSGPRWRIYEALGTTGTAFNEVVSWHSLDEPLSGERVWMTYKASGGHYAALTSSDYTCIGIAFSDLSGVGRTGADLVGGTACDTSEEGKMSPSSVSDFWSAGAAATITGTPVVGSTLKCSAPSIDTLLVEDITSYAYAWKRGSLYEGTGRSYKLSPDDAGKSIRCSVTAHIVGTASDEIWSKPVQVGATRLRLIKAPAVVGRPNAGRKLTCSAGRWSVPVRTQRVWQMRTGTRWVTVGRRSSLLVKRSYRSKQLRCQVKVQAVASASVRSAAFTRSVRVR